MNNVSFILGFLKEAASRTEGRRSKTLDPSRILWKKAEFLMRHALNPDVNLRTHQREAIDVAEESGGRSLMAHGTGTGKTLSAIAVFEAAKKKGDGRRALVITPASLQHNFISKGVHKFTNSSVGEVGSGADYQVISLNKFRNDPKKYLDQVRPDTIIIDEIHRAKDSKTVTYKAYMVASKYPGVKRFLGLTGSFISNHPREVVPLLDIVHPGHQLGSPQTFSKRYTKIRRKQGGFLKPSIGLTILKNKPRLGRDIAGKLHYVEHKDVGEDMPKTKIEDVHVPMSPEQNKMYQFALGRLNAVARSRIRAGLPVNQREATHIFGAIAKARQASNSIETHKEMPLEESAEATPKIKKVLDDVQRHLKKRDDNQAVVYTNLVRGGADVLEAGLRGRGLNPGLYSGTNKDTRLQDYEDFLKRKKRVMVLTPAGGEGVSLDNATFFGEVDRHYNPERNEQALARTVRMGGLAHRDPKDRVIEVKRYYSDPKTGWFWKLLGRREVGIDEWIKNVAKEKDRLNKEMRGVARKGRMKKRAELMVRPSKIHGEGLFTTSRLPAGENIGLGMTQTGNTGSLDADYKQTPHAKKVNHSASPNMKLVRKGGKLFMVTTKPVQSGEELTSDYRHASVEVAKDFLATR